MHTNRPAFLSADPAWADHGFTAREAAPWIAAGFTPDTATPWANRFLSVADALAALLDGISPGAVAAEERSRILAAANRGR
jgi:hypothetical protein